MRKISTMQLVMLLIFAKGYLTMVYAPFIPEVNSVIMMLVLLVSTAVQCVLVLPMLVVYRKHPNINSCDVIFRKSKILGLTVSLIYAVYFTLEAIHALGSYAYYIKNNFLLYFNQIVVIVALILVAVYAANMGLEVIARVAAIVAFIFVINLVLVISSVPGGYDLYKLQIAVPYFKNPAKDFTKAVIDEIGRSADLVALVFFLPHVNKKPAKGVYTFLGLKLLVSEVILFVVTTVLGHYADYSDIPFDEVAAYSKTKIIERFDSIVLMTWTLATFIKVALLLYIMSQCIKKFSLKLKDRHSTLIAAIIAGGATMFFVYTNNWDTPILRNLSGYVILALGTLIPLLVCFIRRKPKEKAT